MERFLLIMLFSVLMLAFATSSCTLSADKEDRERVDELNRELNNFQDEVFELRKEISTLNQTLNERLGGFSERLDQMCESQEDLTRIADSLESLEGHLEIFRLELIDPYYVPEDEEEDKNYERRD